MVDERMSYQLEIETIYYLENPETDHSAFATGSQLKYEDIIKDVCGVACIHDLSMMIQYNKGFQTSICKNLGISEDEIKLDLLLRIASKIDLLQLREKLTSEVSNPSKLSCPFDSLIRLQEGIFEWDNEQSTYRKVQERQFS